MSKITVEAARLARTQKNFREAMARLSRESAGSTGEWIGKARTSATKRADASVFQDLAASFEFTADELREAVDGLDLAGMRLTDPGDFASLAMDVGADVKGMDDPGAVREVIRAILSGDAGK